VNFQEFGNENDEDFCIINGNKKYFLPISKLQNELALNFLSKPKKPILNDGFF